MPCSQTSEATNQGLKKHSRWPPLPLSSQYHNASAVISIASCRSHSFCSAPCTFAPLCVTSVHHATRFVVQTHASMRQIDTSRRSPRATRASSLRAVTPPFNIVRSGLRVPSRFIPCTTLHTVRWGACFYQRSTATTTGRRHDDHTHQRGGRGRD